MFLFLKHCLGGSAEVIYMVLWSLYKRFVRCTVLNESLLSGEFQVFRFVHVSHCFYQKGQWGSVCRYKHCNFVLYSSFFGSSASTPPAVFLLLVLRAKVQLATPVQPDWRPLSVIKASLGPQMWANTQKACWVEDSLADFLLLVGNHWITERSVWTLCK